MKTARFSEVVAASGKPRVHLLLMDPKKDQALQSAIKAHRVMTIHQVAGGATADFGTIGFEETPGQILTFPKSLKRFAGRRVVGVNFALTSDADGATSAVDRQSILARNTNKRPPRKTEEENASASRSDIPFKGEVVPLKARSSPKEADETPTRSAKIEKLPPPDRTAKAGSARSTAYDSLLEKVSRAVELLEKGKAVAAYNLLREAKEEGP